MAPGTILLFFSPNEVKWAQAVRPVNANYRLTFGFEPPDAQEVDLEDYH